MGREWAGVLLLQKHRLLLLVKQPSTQEAGGAATGRERAPEGREPAAHCIGDSQSAPTGGRLFPFVCLTGSHVSLMTSPLEQPTEAWGPDGPLPCTPVRGS